MVEIKTNTILGMSNHSELGTSGPAVDRMAKLKKALFRPGVQLLMFIGVLIVMSPIARVWQPMTWFLSGLLYGFYFAGVVGFLMLAALTPAPYPRHPKILLIRLRQLAKGIWAALMLVLSALLGAAMSADLLRYGTHNFSGFFTEVFVPGYLSTVVQLALWGGMLIYMMLTATDLLIAGESARTEARRRGMGFLVTRLGYDNEAVWPYGIQLLGSVWKNLTGGPAQLLLIGYLTTPLVGLLTYTAIEQLVL